MEQRRIERAWFFIFLAAVTVAFLWLTLDFIEPVFWAAVLAIIFNPLQRQPRRAPAGAQDAGRAHHHDRHRPGRVSSTRAPRRGGVTRGAQLIRPDSERHRQPARGCDVEIDPILRDIAARVGIDPDTIGPRISESIGAAAQLIATRAVVVGQNLLSVAAQTALMLYVLFFFLRDGDKLLATLNYAIPMGDGRQQTLFRRFAAVTRATLKGSLLVGLVQGALGGLLFWVLGLRAPVFWGVIMAMLSLLPIVGPSIVWAPVALYLMFTGSMTKGIILVVGRCAGRRHGGQHPAAAARRARNADA